MVSDDSSEEKENQKPEVELLKEPKDKPPDDSKPPLSSEAESVGEDESMVRPFIRPGHLGSCHG